MWGAQRERQILRAPLGREPVLDDFPGAALRLLPAILFTALRAEQPLSIDFGAWTFDL